MNSLRWLALAAVVIMALAAALLWFEQRGSTVNAVVVALEGPAGTMVAITTEVDGEFDHNPGTVADNNRANG